MKMNVETGTPYTRLELSSAFDLVKSENWKDPIQACTSIAREDITREAVIFYTGSIPTFTSMKNPKLLRVTAEGYYKAVGA